MSSGPYLMTLAEKQERRNAIIALWEAGSAPTEIARRYGLTANYVRVVLKSADVDVDAANGARPKVDRMWELDEDERRRAIIERAAQGCRETMQANRQSLPEVIPAISHNPQDGGLRGERDA
jgi:hypothetical protein